MKTITAVTVTDRVYFVRAGRLVQAEPGDVLVLHESPVFGRRDIDAETARRMIQAERAEASGFLAESAFFLSETAFAEETVPELRRFEGSEADRA